MTDAQVFKVGDIVEFRNEELRDGEVAYSFVRGEIVALVDISTGGHPPLACAIVKTATGGMYVRPVSQIEQYRETRAEALFNAHRALTYEFGASLPNWGDITPRQRALLKEIASRLTVEFRAILEG